jgi:hypothetical protein
MPGYDRCAVIPLQAFMPDALARLLRQAPMCQEKVDFAWRTSVGPAVHAATSVRLADGVLAVRAAGRPWKREIERSATVIRARLSAVLGPDAVRRIEVSVEAPANDLRTL